MSDASRIDDGGAAFPMTQEFVQTETGAEFVNTGGLSRRDYFAAAALPAVIQMCNLDNRQASESDERMFARKALACADALIAASKPGGPEHG